MYAKKSLRASIQRCKVHRGLVHRIWPPPATLSYIYMGKVGTGCIYRRQTKPTIGYGLQSLEKQWENLETWWAKTKAGSNYIELLNWMILNVYNGNGTPEFCGHLLKKSNVQQSWGFNPSTILRLWRLNQNHWSHFTRATYLPAAGAAAGAAAGSAAAGAATVGAAAASWGTGEARAAWRQNRLRIQNFMLPGLRRYWLQWLLG